MPPDSIVNYMVPTEENTGFEPVFPRQPKPRPRRWRGIVVLLVIVLLSGGGLYWWRQSRPATVPTGRAAGIIIAQSARICGGGREAARFPAWLAPDRLLVTLTRDNLTALFTVGMNEAPRPFVSFAPVDQWQFKAFFPAAACQQSAVCRGVVAFAADGNIWRRAADSSLHRLTATDGLAGHPAFTPDGARIFFTVLQHDRLAIWSVDADGKGAEVFLHDAAADFAAPAVSPDGNWLALVSNRGGSPDLWLAHLPDGELTRLTSAPTVETAPAWSPDGSMLAYCAGDDRNTDLWVINADGSRPTQLTFTAVSEYAPAWSPDGTHFACQVGNGPDAAVWTYTIGYAAYNTPR